MNSSKPWPSLFGAAEWHHDVACQYGGVAQLSFVKALASELTTAPRPELDACVGREDKSCGLYADFHLGCWGHSIAAGLLFRALVRDPPVVDNHAPRVPPSPVFMTNEELRTDYAALFVADDQLVIEHVVAADCAPEVVDVKVNEQHRLSAKLCHAGGGPTCAGGWIGPRGTLVNIFHTAGAPKHSGLHFVGEPCGQAISLEFAISNGTRSVRSGYRVRLLFVHSYEHFGNFTTRLEVLGTTHVRELSGRWETRTSIPSAEVIAYLPASVKGKRIRLTIQAPESGTASDHKIAITGLRVLEIEDKEEGFLGNS